MSNRTSEQSVKTLMGSELEKEAFTPFVAAASMMVTDLIAGAGYDTEQLEMIERWLAAHLVASTRDRQVQSQSVLSASETYAALGKGLDSTTYGQMVKMLESKGLLAQAATATRPAFLRVLG